MLNEYEQFEKRKQDHIEYALMSKNQAHECNILDTLSFQHDALPDLNFSELNVQSTRFNVPVKTPFIVSSMTAGHTHAQHINHRLIAACAERGWAMGVGSQRRELTDPHAASEWHSLRHAYPDVSLFSNLGIAQLISTSPDQIQRLIDSLHAEAFIVHCNPLQECIQPEGTPFFKGSWQALEHLVRHAALPIIIKETGCGFSRATLQRLHNVGVAAVDVSGLGGTHWGRIEGSRAQDDPVRQQTSDTFRNWGINTLQCVAEAYAMNPAFEIWGSGGVRHGLDAAKLCALGASTIGFAQPLLQAALLSEQAVNDKMIAIEYEFKTAMFCTGSATISALKEKICL